MQHIRMGDFADKVNFEFCIWFRLSDTQSALSAFFSALIKNLFKFIKIDQGIQMLQLKKDWKSF